MILLTSQSIPRKELLLQVGFTQADFVQENVPIQFDFHRDQSVLSLDRLRELTLEVAKLKIRRCVNEMRALDVLNLNAEETVVVGADTVVFFNGRIYDRPLLISPVYAPAHAIQKAKDQARATLSTLRGQEFYVVTGLVLAQGDHVETCRSQSVVTQATMKNFSDEDLESYIDTLEPLTKAGGFGIQERGVVLFEKIKGSYSNVVGLPLVEFFDLLGSQEYAGRVRLPLTSNFLPATSSESIIPSALRMIAVGDINYDLSFTDLSPHFFTKLTSPGKHIRGELKGAAGGTGAIFALRAHEAGFKHCSVLGKVGGDALGKLVEAELHERGTEILLPADYKQATSIALVLRDQAGQDTALTITSGHQSLSKEDIAKARYEIEHADLVFVSGYCLVDADRRQAAIQAMDWAKNAGQIVVFDAPVDIEQSLSFDQFVEKVGRKIDVLVAETPTILAWCNAKDVREDDWKYLKEQAMPKLREYFSAIFLRTSTYSHELIITPHQEVLGPLELDYPQRPAHKKLGYADERTASHLYQFMAPSILIASSSPRRFALLKQIIAETKLEVLASNDVESFKQGESPLERVKRLALGKAKDVLARQREMSPSIEFVIGADTEIVLDGKLVGHPKDGRSARRMLKTLSGRTHEAITGLAIIHRKTGQLVVDAVSTKVTFKELSQKEITAYVDSGEPIGKAGAYGIQGLGVLFVKEIEGSYSNVVGLPLERLAELLSQEFHMPIWKIDKVSNWELMLEPLEKTEDLPPMTLYTSAVP